MKKAGFILSGVILATLALGYWIVQNPSVEQTSRPENPFRVSERVTVGVIGTDFHWKFRYPGPDGLLETSDDQFSDRKLCLPPGVEVNFHITSEDYVYILGIPLNENESNRVDRDANKVREIAVPELTHYIEHRFDDVGNLDLMVDPLCGFQSLHDPRMGQISVSNSYDFSQLFPAANTTQAKLEQESL